MSVAREKSFQVFRPYETNKFIIRVFNSEKVSKVVKLKFYEKYFFKLKEKNKKIKNRANLRKFRKDDIPILFELITNLTKDFNASIEPNFEDFKWLLEQPITNCVIYEKNKEVKGFMLAWEFQLAGFGNSIPFGWIDIIHIKNLSIQEAKDLSLYLSETSNAKGWVGLQSPYIPYYNSKPLQKANFVFFPKKLSFDIILLNNIEIPEKFSSVYFDWR
ncbi:MAG: hypothetical protein K9W45_04160 [Candidatus Heimdallarchaeum aukensis]|uniref:Uncharacterized protein n=1 Tax=Candidatus Heimdallarchaeum aukensis TaxID=2876573 RepID=A0A9Y1FLS2_9ARCH|nr:MAG: hypothetical protein K9W45_04160 [Candidatus Heimdallarchaeum aukensis]